MDAPAMSRGELAQGCRASNMDCRGKRSASPLLLARRRRADQSAVALRLPAQSKAGRERREGLRRLGDEREFTDSTFGASEKSYPDLKPD